ncbi:MAG: hypothetical protein MJK04_27505 [Psychrosphaera sp.]|nr:hypothetical protein [Psychrosphaera sp.]
MSLIVSNQKASEKLVALYDQCTADEQTIMRVLAVVFESVNQTTLNRRLEALVIKKALADNSKMLKMSSAIKNSLSRKGLLIINQSNLSIPKQLMQSLTVKCRELDDLATVYKSIYIELPLTPRFHAYYVTPVQKERQVREQFYLQNWENLLPMLKSDDNPDYEDYKAVSYLTDCLFYPYNQVEFDQLPFAIRAIAVEQLMNQLREARKEHGEIIVLLSRLADDSSCLDSTKSLLVEHYLLSEQLDKASEVLNQMQTSLGSLMLSGWLAFAQGKMDLCISLFEQCKVAKNKVKRRTRQYVGGVPGIFYALALLKTGYEGEPGRLNQLITEAGNVEVDKKYESEDKQCFSCLGAMGKIVSGKNVDEFFYDLRYQRYNEGFGFQWGVLLSALTYAWQDKSLPGHYITTLKKYFELAYQAGDHIYARAAARLLNRGANPHLPAKNFLHNHWTKATDLFDLLKPKEKWLQALDQLIALDVKAVDDKTVSVEKQVRMSWFIRDDEFGHKLEAREQK